MDDGATCFGNLFSKWCLVCSTDPGCRDSMRQILGLMGVWALDDVDGLLLDFLPVQLMKNPMLLKYLPNWTLMPMAVRKSWTVPFEMGAGESLSANKWSLEVRKVKTALKITWLLLFNITEGTSFFYWILAEIQQHWYSTFSPSHSVKEKGEGRPLGKLWQGLTWECLVIYSLWATTSCHLRDCSIRGVRGNSNHIRQVPGSWIMVKTLGRWLSCITMTTHGNPCKNNWESG